jgi:hypothetical protein
MGAEQSHRGKSIPDMMADLDLYVEINKSKGYKWRRNR